MDLPVIPCSCFPRSHLDEKLGRFLRLVYPVLCQSLHRLQVNHLRNGASLHRKTACVQPHIVSQPVSAFVQWPRFFPSSLNSASKEKLVKWATKGPITQSYCVNCEQGGVTTKVLSSVWESQQVHYSERKHSTLVYLFKFPFHAFHTNSTVHSLYMKTFSSQKKTKHMAEQ